MLSILEVVTAIYQVLVLLEHFSNLRVAWINILPSKLIERWL